MIIEFETEEGSFVQKEEKWLTHSLNVLEQDSAQVYEDTLPRDYR